MNPPPSSDLVLLTARYPFDDHEAVLDPWLDARRVELHPPHGVAQERARERHLIAPQMLVAVPDDDVGLIRGDEVAARSAHGIRQAAGGLGGEPDARRVGRGARHRGIA